MSAVPATSGQTAVRVIRPSPGWPRPPLGELWHRRELLLFFTWRDLKVRYAQTVLGASWSIAQPLMLALVFSLAFRRIGKVSTGEIPYAVFAFSGLVFWTFFARSVSRGSDSLVANAYLLTKIYFPRLLIPLSSLLSATFDFLVAFLALLVFAGAYGTLSGWELTVAPAVMVLGAVFALGVTLMLSALNVYYRDVSHGTPFFLQLWLFLSPVAYPTSALGEPWTTILSLNPATGIVEGFRWAVVGGDAPSALALAVSVGTAAATLVAGLFYFSRVERTFADVV